MVKCVVCEFNFDDTAAKCPFCGHVVGAVLPERTAPAATPPPAMASPPSEWATQPPPVTVTGYAAAPPAAAPTDPAAFATQPAPTMMGGYATPAPTAYAATAPTATSSSATSSAGLTARLAIAALTGVILGAVAFLVVLLLRG